MSTQAHEAPIRIYLLQGKKRENASALLPLYDQCFQTWYETWDKTNKVDFHAGSDLTTDEFTRQDHILAIFYHGECAALLLFSDMDFDDASARRDSYFSDWPETAIQGLCAHGKRISKLSQFTVAEKFRRTGPAELENTPWKYILMGMMNKYCLANSKCSMSGKMRVNRGMEKLAYAFGATPLLQNQEYLIGTERAQVDLVAFFQNEVRIAYDQNPLAHHLDRLWESRNGRQWHEEEITSHLQTA